MILFVIVQRYWICIGFGLCPALCSGTHFDRPAIGFGSAAAVGALIVESVGGN